METVVTKDNFKDFLANNEVVILDFWAAWCGPCRMLGPEIERVCDELGYALGKVNADIEEELCIAFEISSIPALFMFKNGKLVKKTVGFRPYAALKEWVLE